MKKMFDLMMQKKWLLLVLAIVVVAALVIGIVAVTGCGEKDPNPTEGTSNVGVTDPTGTTGGNGDNTDPSDVSEPSGPISDEPDTDDPGVDDPTEVPGDDPSPSDPAEPTLPNGEMPDVTPPPGPNDDDEDEDPSEGNGSATPSTPPQDDKDPDPDGDEPVIKDPKPTERPADTSHDFGGVTPSNVTIADVTPWSSSKYQAWLDTYGPQFNTWDQDTRWRWLCVTTGFVDPYYKDGFYCGTEDGYKSLVAQWEEPCDYCGKSRCEDALFRNENGFSEIDPRRCSKYDIHKDPMEYCQTCGLILGENGCYKSVTGRPCKNCGEERAPMECHTCKKDGED